MHRKSWWLLANVWIVNACCSTTRSQESCEQNKATIAATWRMDGACQWKHGRGWKWTKHSIAPCHKHEPLSTCRMGNSASVLELGAMAIALQKNVCAMENTHSTRLPCVCYPAQPWSRHGARAQHFRLCEICASTCRNTQHSKQCKQHLHLPQWCQPFWAFDGNMEHTSKALN